MKSIKKFENKKVANMSTTVAGKRVTTNHNTKDSEKRDGRFFTNVGMFDGPRD